MNATRRHAGEAGAGRGAPDAAVRGGLLIAAAVIVGLLLLWRAHDDDTSAAGNETVTENTTPTDGGAGTTLPPDGSTDPNATSTTLPVVTATTHLPAEVPVLVANGSGTRGGASAVTAKLVPWAYATLPAADADRSDYPASVVYYREGFAEDARAIARQLGVAEPVDAIIQPMPATPPVRGTNGTANAAQAQVLVLLGADNVIKQS
jgi:hypothetical protein